MHLMTEMTLRQDPVTVYYRTECLVISGAVQPVQHEINLNFSSLCYEKQR